MYSKHTARSPFSSCTQGGFYQPSYEDTMIELETEILDGIFRFLLLLIAAFGRVVDATNLKVPNRD
eukprot:SAG31_NODE_4550_length_3145_cov_2.221274_2_plen_66_part_00